MEIAILLLKDALDQQKQQLKHVEERLKRPLSTTLRAFIKKGEQTLKGTIPELEDAIQVLERYEKGAILKMGVDFASGESQSVEQIVENKNIE